MKNFKYVLYCGRSIKGKMEASDLEIDSFLTSIVSPLFPGFTYQESIGYWKGEKERSFMITILDENDRAGDVNKIASSYKFFFFQESVLIETSKVEIDFS